MAEEVWSSWLCNLVTGLKERDTIKEITSKLAYKIQSLWTWSTRFGHGSRTKQISSRKTYLFKSDLGNDVDQDVMEYIEEEENQSLIR